MPRAETLSMDLLWHQDVYQRLWPSWQSCIELVKALERPHSETRSFLHCKKEFCNIDILCSPDWRLSEINREGLSTSAAHSQALSTHTTPPTTTMTTTTPATLPHAKVFLKIYLLKVMVRSLRFKSMFPLRRILKRVFQLLKYNGTLT